jgi:general secretion pathway protein E
MASSVSGIVAQRLVRKNCEECKKTFHPGKGVIVELGFPENTRRRFYRGEGCPVCFGTGYKGRTGIFEVVEIREDLRKAITANTDEDELRELAVKRFQPLFAAGVDKVLKGVTTPSEVLKAVTIF